MLPHLLPALLILEPAILSIVLAILRRDLRLTDLAPAFRGLFLEEPVDGVGFFLLVAFLGQVFAAAGHFGAAHGVFFGREVFFDLGFWKSCHVRCVCSAQRVLLYSARREEFGLTRDEEGLMVVSIPTYGQSQFHEGTMEHDGSKIHSPMGNCKKSVPIT